RLLVKSPAPRPNAPATRRTAGVPAAPTEPGKRTCVVTEAPPAIETGSGRAAAETEFKVAEESTTVLAVAVPVLVRVKAATISPVAGSRVSALRTSMAAGTGAT